MCSSVPAACRGQLWGWNWRVASSSPWFSSRVPRPPERNSCWSKHFSSSPGDRRDTRRRGGLTSLIKRLLEKNITDESQRGFLELQHVGTSKDISRSCEERWRGRYGGEIMRNERKEGGEEVQRWKKEPWEGATEEQNRADSVFTSFQYTVSHLHVVFSPPKRFHIYVFECADSV